MEELYYYLLAPFVEFAFMRRALSGTLMLAASSCPIGVFLTLRRMSQTGDALAHGILPGVAAGFLIFGLQLVPMTIGGMVAGLVVSVGASVVSRLTVQKEDSSLAVFYMISLSAGVLLVSLRGSNIDLMQVLFGSVLGLNSAALMLIFAILTVTSIALGICWRAIVADCMDPLFLRSVSRWGAPIHMLFLLLVVLNLVGSFQALGTLLSVGLMTIPAATSRFWCRRVGHMCMLAACLGMVASVAGLLLSYHASLPSGPSIVLAAGAMYVASLLAAPRGLLLPWIHHARRAPNPSTLD